MKPERKIAVAKVTSNKGLDQRIELLTVADLVHLFALSMGYRPDIAFAFGVIARSVPDVQSGECDLTIETAQKGLRLASIISSCRQNQTLPEDVSQVETVLAATAHVHTIEQAYTELCQNIPEIAETFYSQYNDWSKKQQAKETERTAPKSALRRIIGKWLGL